ncbi:RNA-splicing factor [Terramyces sp. JEL0728]|nr:RNA-splicing factor [Terramyces sp. JEL0728]KAJ3273658.1 RNA-splicing factor [Terramyces sp. JEL0728]
MGGGDLNLKKSWHPNTYKNQEIVWKREQEVEKEKRKLEQLRKEIQEERDRDELLGLHDTSKGRQKNIRLEWMYASGPSQQNDFVEQEKEAFLLGKKRIDKVDQPSVNQVDKPAGNSVYGMLANSQRDFQNKVRDDPLLEFRRQEQLTLEAMLKNPLRLKELQKRKEKEERKRQRKEKKKEDRKRDRSYSPETRDRSLERRDRSSERRDRSPERRDRSPETRDRSPERRDRSSEKSYERRDRSVSPKRKRNYSHYDRELTVK